MKQRGDDIDGLVGTLKPVDDETLASLSHTQAAQALYEEVTTVSSSTATKVRTRRGRRRLVWQGALVAGATITLIAVLSIVNVFGADGPSIVDKAAAALDPGEHAIIHVKILGTEQGEGGYLSSWTEESFTLTSSPYTRREIRAFEGSPADEIAQNSDGLFQAYDAASNTIYQPPQETRFRVEGEQTDRYREMILELLSSGEAVVEGTETVNGRECVVIAATKDYGVAPDGTRYGTWYLVDADTNNPVEWRMTRDGGKVVTFRFEVYEHLPATGDNLALLDLAAQHPGATLNTSLEDYQDAMGIPRADPGPAKGPGH